MKNKQEVEPKSADRCILNNDQTNKLFTSSASSIFKKDSKCFDQKKRQVLTMSSSASESGGAKV